MFIEDLLRTMLFGITHTQGAGSITHEQGAVLCMVHRCLQKNKSLSITQQIKWAEALEAYYASIKVKLVHLKVQVSKLKKILEQVTLRVCKNGIKGKTSNLVILEIESFLKNSFPFA